MLLNAPATSTTPTTTTPAATVVTPTVAAPLNCFTRMDAMSAQRAKGVPVAQSLRVVLAARMTTPASVRQSCDPSASATSPSVRVRVTVSLGCTCTLSPFSAWRYRLPSASSAPRSPEAAPLERLVVEEHPERAKSAALTKSAAEEGTETSLKKEGGVT